MYFFTYFFIACIKFNNNNTFIAIIADDTFSNINDLV